MLPNMTTAFHLPLMYNGRACTIVFVDLSCKIRRMCFLAEKRKMAAQTNEHLDRKFRDRGQGAYVSFSSCSALGRGHVWWVSVPLDASRECVAGPAGDGDKHEHAHRRDRPRARARHRPSPRGFGERIQCWPWGRTVSPFTLANSVTARRTPRSSAAVK